MYLLLLLFGQLQPIPMPNGDAVEAILQMDAAPQYEVGRTANIGPVKESAPVTQSAILDALYADVYNDREKYQKAYMDGVFGAQGAWEAMDPATRPHRPFAVDQRGSYSCCAASLASCLDTILGYQAMHPEMLAEKGMAPQEWQYAAGWGPGISYGRSCTQCCSSTQVVKYTIKYGYAFLKEYSDENGNYADFRKNNDSLRLWNYSWQGKVPRWLLDSVEGTGHILPASQVKYYSRSEWTPSLAVDVFAQGGSMQAFGYRTGNGRPLGYRPISAHVQAIVGLDGSPEMRDWVEFKWGKTLADDDIIVWFDQSFSTGVDQWSGEISAADWPPWYPTKRYPGAWPWRLKDAMRWLQFSHAYFPAIAGFPIGDKPPIEPIIPNIVRPEQPYLQTFDRLPGRSEGWTYQSTGDGKIDILNNKLRMEDTTRGGYSRNTAILHLDLLGQDSAALIFGHKRFSDETHNSDGVYFSPDGEIWDKLNGFDSAITGTFKIKLRSPFTADSQIKFQQYDNYPIPYDGREWDNILVEIPPPLIYLTLPISETFESDLPVVGWEYTSTGDGRIGVVDGRLRLDDATNRGYSSNTVIINVDLKNAANVVLEYNQYRINDETDRLPKTYIGPRNGDGVSVSNDGVVWQSLPLWNGRISVKIPSDTIQIKFQQYDNYPVKYDGREWDNILIEERR